jgi:hypothetical protein
MTEQSVINSKKKDSRGETHCQLIFCQGDFCQGAKIWPLHFLSGHGEAPNGCAFGDE